MIQASSRVALVACGVVMLAALAFASSAFAARHGLFAEVALKSSNGYYVSIVAHRWKRPPGRGEVSVSVQKDNPFAASYGRTAYTTHGKLTKHRLKANLGSFGRIALRFRPNARRGEVQQLGPTPPPGSLATRFFQRLLGCAVEGAFTNGHFKGRIHFEGEDGYVHVRAHHAPGFLSPATASCSKSNPVHGVALDARSNHVMFEADRYRKQRGALFFAREREKAGRVAIERVALAGGREQSFTYDSGLTSADVRPASDPFSGSGELTPAGDWLGSLAVSFPGAPDVPLAGADFAAQLGRF